MSGDLTPEDRIFLREHKVMVDGYVSAAMSAGRRIGPIAFEAIARPLSADHAVLARAARLVKRIIDSAQPCFE